MKKKILPDSISEDVHSRWRCRSSKDSRRGKPSFSPSTLPDSQAFNNKILLVRHLDQKSRSKEIIVVQSHVAIFKHAYLRQVGALMVQCVRANDEEGICITRKRIGARGKRGWLVAPQEA